jgi:hypothetical protein
MSPSFDRSDVRRNEMRAPSFEAVSTVALILGLSGCADQAAVLPGFQAQPSVIGLRIIDARPDEDKTTEYLSYIIFSCDYGIRRLGDEKTVPPRLTLLRRDLESALGRQVGNATITVSRYRIFFNRGAALREQTSSQFPGVMPALMLNAGSHCAQEETRGGWYAASEAKSPHSPFIVELEGTFAGKSVAVRTVYSPEKEFLGVLGEPETAAALFAAMRQATAALIEQLRAGNGTPPDRQDPDRHPPALP